MNHEILLAIISSSAIGVFISTISQPLVEMIKNRIALGKIRDKRAYKNSLMQISKKEDTYLKALEYLMRIRRGFDISDHELQIFSKNLKKKLMN